MARKNIEALIDELKSWLPNYDHGEKDYPTVLYRILACAPGGEELEDMGYEPIGSLGWQELDQLGRVLVAIQDKGDVEDLVAGLIHEEGEEVEETRRRHMMRDFTSPIEALESAQQQGAKFAADDGAGGCYVFFPISAGSGYERAVIFNQHGRWHVGAIEEGKLVHLPSNADAIGDAIFMLRGKGGSRTRETMPTPPHTRPMRPTARRPMGRRTR
jgi:hypothetical protein